MHLPFFFSRVRTTSLAPTRCRNSFKVQNQFVCRPVGKVPVGLTTSSISKASPWTRRTSSSTLPRIGNFTFEPCPENIHLFLHLFFLVIIIDLLSFVDRLNVVWLIMILHGIGALTSWNMFITAKNVSFLFLVVFYFCIFQRNRLMRFVFSVSVLRRLQAIERLH